MALKATTSIEEEFGFLFEYVVKDRALRNFYREKRDAMIEKEEKERNDRLNEMAKKSSSELNVSKSSDSMSISGSSSSEGSTLHLPSVRKRNDSPSQPGSRKRACL